MSCGGSSRAEFNTLTIYSLWFNTTNMIQRLKLCMLTENGKMWMCWMDYIKKNEMKKYFINFCIKKNVQLHLCCTNICIKSGLGIENTLLKIGSGTGDKKLIGTFLN